MLIVTQCTKGMNCFVLVYQDGFTALMYASRKGHTEIVRMLLENPRLDIGLSDKVRCELLFLFRKIIMYV